MLVDADGAHSLIALCHGWHGHPTRTWGELIDIYRKTDLFAGYDVLFLGYKRAPSSVSLLSQIVVESLSSVFPMLRYPTEDGVIRRDYKDIFLVGHSLGTLALRRAVLDFYQKRGSCECSRRVTAEGDLLLFAPPHYGVDWELYLRAFSNGIRRLLEAIRRATEPILDDLKPGCDFLVDLEKRTTSIRAGGQDAIPAATVFLAAEDRVIIATGSELPVYPGDRTHVFPAQDHRSICKFTLEHPAFDVFIEHLLRDRLQES